MEMCFKRKTGYKGVSSIRKEASVFRKAFCTMTWSKLQGAATQQSTNSLRAGLLLHSYHMYKNYVHIGNILKANGYPRVLTGGLAFYRGEYFFLQGSIRSLYSAVI